MLVQQPWIQQDRALRFIPVNEPTKSFGGGFGGANYSSPAQSLRNDDVDYVIAHAWDGLSQRPSKWQGGTRDRTYKEIDRRLRIASKDPEGSMQHARDVGLRGRLPLIEGLSDAIANVVEGGMSGRYSEITPVYAAKAAIERTRAMADEHEAKRNAKYNPSKYIDGAWRYLSERAPEWEAENKDEGYAEFRRRVPISNNYNMTSNIIDRYTGVSDEAAGAIEAAKGVFDSALNASNTNVNRNYNRGLDAQRQIRANFEAAHPYLSASAALIEDIIPSSPITSVLSDFADGEGGFYSRLENVFSGLGGPIVDYFVDEYKKKNANRGSSPNKVGDPDAHPKIVVRPKRL
jgi:hypothetical protein